MNNKKIGEFLASLRKVKGLTQQQLAETFFISNKSVSKWECGETIPDISLLPALAEFYGVTVDEILAGERKCTGKVNTKETQLRQTDNQNKYLVLNTQNKFDLFFIINLILLLTSAVLYGVLELVLTTKPAYSKTAVALGIAVFPMLISIVLYVYSIKNTKNKLNYFQDRVLLDKLNDYVNRKKCVYLSLLFTLLFGSMAIMFINSDTLQTLGAAMLCLTIPFCLFIYNILVRFYGVNPIFSKIFIFLQKYKILPAVAIVSAVILMFVATDTINFEVIQDGVVIQSSFYICNVVNAIKRYGSYDRVLTFAILYFVFFTIGTAAFILAAVKKKTTLPGWAALSASVVCAMMCNKTAYLYISAVIGIL